MELERSKNAKRGVIAGTFNRVVGTFFPFLIRTVMIHKMGADYLGLNSLFGSILQVLSLSELGFSSAIVYSMYQPLADNDTDKVNALLLFYKRIYRVIGVVISLLGILLMPFLHLFMKSEPPKDVNVYVIYLIYLFNTVISYFFFGYLSSILNAHQKLDVISIITSLSQTMGYVCQLIVLIFFSNYYLYIIFLPFATLINNVMTAFSVRKMYPQYKSEGILTKEQRQDIWKRVYGIMIEKICGTTRNALDSICISAFIGLAATAVYNNYFYVISSLNAFFYVVCNSVQPGVGNSVALKEPEKNYEDMRNLNFGYMLVSGWSFICLVCLYQPFMILWIGKGYLLPFSSVLLFATYFYVLRMGDIRSVYAQATGLWWENRHLAIIESVLNVVLNLVLVRIYGINGVIAATLISLFGINFCMSSGIVFKYYFRNGKLKDFFEEHLAYVLITAAAGVCTAHLCEKIECSGFVLLAMRAIICVVIPMMIYFAIYLSFKSTRGSLVWIIERVSGRNKKEMFSIIKKIDKRKVFTEILIYIVLTIFFFWFQRYMENLSYMYFDKVTLGVRGIYSLVLADTAISVVKKFRRFRQKDVVVKSGNSSKWTNRLSDCLYYLSFAACYSLAYIAVTKLNVLIPVYGGIHRLGITLCCMMVLVLYNRKAVEDIRWLLLQTIMLVAAFGYMGCFGDIWIYAIAIFTVASYKRKFIPSVWIALTVSGVMLNFVPWLSFEGIVQFIIKDNKHAYGYGGPNEVSMQIVFWVMMYFFLRYHSKTKADTKGDILYKRNLVLSAIDAVILAAGTKMIVSYTSGRASIVCILAMFVGTVFMRFMQIFPINEWSLKVQSIVSKLEFLIFVPSYFYIAAFSFASTYFYDSEKPYSWLQLIDNIFDSKTLKARLNLGKEALLQYRPSIFGTEIIESSSDNYFWVDNFYIRSYLKYGVLLFICMMVAFTVINYIYWKKKHYYVVFLMTILAGLGFLEAQIGDIMYNVFPLMLFSSDVGIAALCRDKKYKVMKQKEMA